MTEWLHFHFSLSCIREGNGNPLQCSCLENPKDGGPGRLPSMGSHRVGHDWSDLAAAAKSHYHTGPHSSDPTYFSPSRESNVESVDIPQMMFMLNTALQIKKKKKVIHLPG